MFKWLQITAKISVYVAFIGKSYLYTQLHLISIYNITFTSTDTEKLSMEKYTWSVCEVCIEILCI